MEEKDSEQTINQQPSTSSIDQITKVPTSKPKAKVKNPKRVAAGKKLSQYNKKAHQSRDAAVKEEQKLIQENQDDDGDGQWLPKTSFSSIIALLGLGLAAIDLFLRYKSQRFNAKIDSIDNSELVNSVEPRQGREREGEISPHEVDDLAESRLRLITTPLNHRKSFGGME